MRWRFVTLLFPAVLLFAARPVAAAPQDAASFADRVLGLTNTERQNAGLAPLTMSPQLSDAARNYSEVLATTGCFEHTCGPVPNFVDRDVQAGYTDWTALGENIAAGFTTPEAVVAGWMASPAHRANILSPKFSEMGVGMVTANDRYGMYWAQEFGSRPASTLTFAPLPTPSDEDDAGHADSE